MGTGADTGALPFQMAVQIDCPHCRAPLQGTVPQIVDLARMPELRPSLVQGRAHHVVCRSCGVTLKLVPPFLVWNPTTRTLLGVGARADDVESDAHFARLARSLCAAQPAAQGIPVRRCASHGALVDALLEGHWDAPEAAGLQAEGAWRALFPHLVRHVRVRVFDLLAAGSQQDVLAAAQDDMEMAAAIQLAVDPQAVTHTGAMRLALQAVSLSTVAAPSRVFDTIVGGLAETVDDAERHAPMRSLLCRALIEIARRLPWVPETGDDWVARAVRMVPALANPRDALAMFDIAASGHAELGPPPFDLSLAAALSHLLDAVLRIAEPASWTPMALEQLGELSLGIEPPELQGIDHLAAAAQGFEDSQRPDDAARVWCRLMRWHAARAGGAAGVDDPTAEAEASLAAGAHALQLSGALPPERAMAVASALAGTAWRMPGDGRAARLALAAQLYRHLLPVTDAVDTSAGQVQTRLNLANVLLDNAGGDDAAAVEEVIALLTPLADHPGVDADATLARGRLAALAVAWKRRTAGEVADNLEHAIGCYRQALSMPGEDAIDDVRDGTPRYNLANALLRRQRGDRRQNLHEALALHEAVRDARAAAGIATQLQARSAMAIGNVEYEWALLGQPPDAARLTRAIDAYAAARQRFDAATVPSDAAMATMLEGQARALLPRDDPRRESAFSLYAQAAELARRAGAVAQQEDIAARSGSMLFRDHRLDEAVAAYAEALRCRRELMALATSGLTRERQLGGMAPYASRLAYALIHTGRLDEGVDALQSARAVDLASALRGVQADSDAAMRYRAVRAEMLKLEAEEERLGGAATGLHALHLRLQQARLQLAEATRALGPDASDEVAGGLAGLASGLAPHTLLAIPIATDIGTTIVFAGCGSSTADARVDLDGFTLPMLRQLVDAWQPIVAALSGGASGRAEGDIPGRMVRFFARLGGTPLAQALRHRVAASGAQNLRVVGLGGLQSLPLAMALDPENLAPLALQASLTTQIGLRPGASASRLAAQRPKLLIVADPQGDLPSARWEAALIASGADASRVDIEVLLGAQATVAALLARIEWADILHFAGHAAHDWKVATRSSLACADGLLSVQALRTAALRAPLELVVLSACASGLTDATRLPEEFIGLPAAFFALGAQAVVSAMWSLQDEATALLMADFYRGVLEERAPYADALLAAQYTLASRTAAELHIADRLDLLYQAGQRRDPPLARRVLAHRRAPDARPFAHPLYWGAHLCQAR